MLLSHPPRNPIHCQIPTASDAWTGQRKSGEEEAERHGRGEERAGEREGAQENTHSAALRMESHNMIYCFCGSSGSEKEILCFIPDYVQILETVLSCNTPYGYEIT